LKWLLTAEIAKKECTRLGLLPATVEAEAADWDLDFGGRGTARVRGRRTSNTSHRRRDALWWPGGRQAGVDGPFVVRLQSAIYSGAKWAGQEI